MDSRHGRMSEGELFWKRHWSQWTHRFLVGLKMFEVLSPFPWNCWSSHLWSLPTRSSVQRIGIVVPSHWKEITVTTILFWTKNSTFNRPPDSRLGMVRRPFVDKFSDEHSKAEAVPVWRRIQGAGQPGMGNNQAALRCVLKHLYTVCVYIYIMWIASIYYLFISISIYININIFFSLSLSTSLVVMRNQVFWNLWGCLIEFMASLSWR
jgi:hypothetical protein